MSPLTLALERFLHNHNGQVVPTKTTQEHLLSLTLFTLLPRHTQRCCSQHGILRARWNRPLIEDHRTIVSKSPKGSQFLLKCEKISEDKFHRAEVMCTTTTSHSSLILAQVESHPRLLLDSFTFLSLGGSKPLLWTSPKVTVLNAKFTIIPGLCGGVTSTDFFGPWRARLLSSLRPTPLPWTLPMETVLATPTSWAESSLTCLTPKQEHCTAYISRVSSPFPQMSTAWVCFSYVVFVGVGGGFLVPFLAPLLCPSFIELGCIHRGSLEEENQWDRQGSYRSRQIHVWIYWSQLT